MADEVLHLPREIDERPGPAAAEVEAPRGLDAHRRVVALGEQAADGHFESPQLGRLQSAARERLERARLADERRQVRAGDAAALQHRRRGLVEARAEVPRPRRNARDVPALDGRELVPERRERAGRRRGAERRLSHAAEAQDHDADARHGRRLRGEQRDVVAQPFRRRGAAERRRRQRVRREVDAQAAVARERELALEGDLEDAVVREVRRREGAVSAAGAHERLRGVAEIVRREIEARERRRARRDRRRERVADVATQPVPRRVERFQSPVAREAPRERRAARVAEVVLPDREGPQRRVDLEGLPEERGLDAVAAQVEMRQRLVLRESVADRHRSRAEVVGRDVEVPQRLPFQRAGDDVAGAGAELVAAQIEGGERRVSAQVSESVIASAQLVHDEAEALHAARLERLQERGAADVAEADAVPVEVQRRQRRVASERRREGFAALHAEVVALDVERRQRRVREQRRGEGLAAGGSQAAARHLHTRQRAVPAQRGAQGPRGVGADVVEAHVERPQRLVRCDRRRERSAAARAGAVAHHAHARHGRVERQRRRERAAGIGSDAAAVDAELLELRLRQRLERGARAASFVEAGCIGDVDAPPLLGRHER